MLDQYLIYFIPILFLCMLAFFAISFYQRKSMVWTGIVIDKGFDEHTQSNDNGGGIQIGKSLRIGGNVQNYVSRKYYIRVKTDVGQELKWNISEGLYGVINIGDRLAKDAGTQIPRVVQAAAK